MIDKTFAETFTNEWISAWNTHDLDRIISHYASELEFKSPLIVERYNDPTGTITTRDKLKEYFNIGLTNNTALHFELIDLTIGVDGITLYYKNARGGQTAEYFEFNSAGKVTLSISCYSAG